MSNASRLQRKEISPTVTKLCVEQSDEIGEIHLHSNFVCHYYWFQPTLQLIIWIILMDAFMVIQIILFLYFRLSGDLANLLGRFSALEIRSEKMKNANWEKITEWTLHRSPHLRLRMICLLSSSGLWISRLENTRTDCPKTHCYPGIVSKSEITVAHTSHYRFRFHKTCPISKHGFNC